MINCKEALVAVAKKEEPEKIHITVEKALNYLGGIKKFITSGQKVLIKPNYTGDLPYKSGAVTSPAVIEAIIILLKELGVIDIIIGDGCGTIHIGTYNIFKHVGLVDIATKYNVKLIDLNKEPMRTITNSHFIELDKVKLAKIVYEVDLIINVPVLKTHFITDVTIALKNMKGVLAPKEKRRFHRINIHKAIADLNFILPRYLTIVDGIIAQEGLGPAEGEPVNLDLIIAGIDSVAIDTVGAKIMGFDPKKIKHIKFASEIGLGCNKIENIRVLGEPLNQFKYKFKPALTELKKYKNVNIDSVNACSACIAATTIALDRMSKNKDLEKFEYFEIKLGTGPFDLDNLDHFKNCFCIGTCTYTFYNKNRKDFKKLHYIPGCAPPGLDIEEKIREIYGVQRSEDNKFSAKDYN